MSKFTPGPWHVEGFEICGHGAEYICDLGNDYESNENHVADAKLIAAAPELLEALMKLRNEAYAVLSLAEAEIAQSAGTTNLKCLCLRLEEADAAIAKATL